MEILQNGQQAFLFSVGIIFILVGKVFLKVYNPNN